MSQGRQCQSWEIYENNHKIFAIFTINPLNFFLSTLAKHTLFSPNYPSLQSKRSLVRQAQVLVRQAPVAPCLGATNNLSHHALVRQAPVAPSFVRQAPVAPSFVRQVAFFYLRSNLIRQPKQQNKISFLIL